MFKEDIISHYLYHLIFLDVTNNTVAGRHATIHTEGTDKMEQLLQENDSTITKKIK